MPDSLRDYLTGGANNTNQALSLGGVCSSHEWGGLAMYIDKAINNITVDFASGANDLGDGILECVNVNTLKWRNGETVQIANGETKLLVDNSNGKFLRVTRTSANDLQIGQCTVTLSSPYNNVFGFNNVSSGDSVVGKNYYRAVIVKNVSGATVFNFKRWISPDPTLSQMVSSVSQLGVSGPGTLTGVSGLTNWPSSGYCRITDGGSLQEIVYYNSRTSTSLNVIARGLLGTVAVAGVNTDLLASVPGFAIAIDPTGVTGPGAIQTIANENTPPIGVSWETGITFFQGLQIGNLLANQQVGIWIWLQVPPLTHLSLGALNMINSSFER